jgi:hypothetical protein
MQGRTGRPQQRSPSRRSSTAASVANPVPHWQTHHLNLPLSSRASKLRVASNLPVRPHMIHYPWLLFEFFFMRTQPRAGFLTSQTVTGYYQMSRPRYSSSLQCLKGFAQLYLVSLALTPPRWLWVLTTRRACARDMGLPSCSMADTVIWSLFDGGLSHRRSKRKARPLSIAPQERRCSAWRLGMDCVVYPVHGTIWYEDVDMGCAT